MHPTRHVSAFLAISLLLVLGCGTDDSGTGPSAGGEKDIVAFFFGAETNSALAQDITGQISDTVITVILPCGTDASALVATFVTSGQEVTLGDAAQESGVTSVNFTDPVTYSVVAEDGTRQDFSVTVAHSCNSSREIVAFSFEAADNPVLGEHVTATVSGTGITAEVPYGTDVTSLVATFASTGGAVTVNGVQQRSGITSNDFTSAVTFTVVATDQSTQDYTVTISVASSADTSDTSVSLLSFAFEASNNSGLSADITGTVGDSTVEVSAPSGTDVTALVATFTTTGDTVEVGTVVQQSGATANDFTSPVTYTVTAGGSVAQDYTVTVSITPATDTADTSKEIVTFSFQAFNNTELSANAAGIVGDSTIAVTVPSGTDVTALVATFTTTGDTVKIGTTVQGSGVTANDYTNSVRYTVVARDSSSRDYGVTVTVATPVDTVDTAKAISSFTLEASNNAGLSENVIGVVGDATVTVRVAVGTDVTALVATFATTGDTVKIGTVVQESGVTANDFTNAVTYTVVAADGSSGAYTVTVTAQATATLLSFVFEAARNGPIDTDAVGVIGDTTVTVSVPHGLDLTALVATFTTGGDSVTSGGVLQESEVTDNDFSTPLTYTVFGGDSSKNFVVSVAYEAVEIAGAWANTDYVLTVYQDSIVQDLSAEPDNRIGGFVVVDNAGDFCVVVWTAHPQSADKHQKIAWTALSGDTIAIEWFEMKNNRVQALNGASLGIVDTLTAQ